MAFFKELHNTISENNLYMTMISEKNNAFFQNMSVVKKYIIMPECFFIKYAEMCYIDILIQVKKKYNSYIQYIPQISSFILLS